MISGKLIKLPGVGDGQGGLECYNSWGRKESDTTETLKGKKKGILISPASVLINGEPFD